MNARQPSPVGWGHLGSGAYANPVLPGDYSDPDVIRVGDDYWMITSTFQYSPGMAILHSRDLVSWRHVGAAVPDISVLGPEYRSDRMDRYNRGIYAGSLRHHRGRYWLHFTTLDEGIFVTTAEHPAGPWSPLHRLSDETGWDDPCPLWDDDGRAWLVASSPGRGAWITWLIPMSSDGRWEKRLLLQGLGPDREREPNQGALVDHADGSWSLVTHHGRGGYADGRPVSVLPVRWVDGWPVVGAADAPGRMVWRARSRVPATQPAGLALDDDFDAGELAPDWEWNHAPRVGSWTLADGLVLRASRPLRPGDIRAVPSTLTRRLLGTAGSTASIRLHTGEFAYGQTAGLGVLCRRSSSITVTREGDLFRVATTGDHPATGPTLESGPLWLQLVVDARDYVTYAYSLDGTTFDPLGNTDTASRSDYRGARIALFSTAPTDDAGAARFDTFRYRVDASRR